MRTVLLFFTLFLAFSDRLVVIASSRGKPTTSTPSSSTQTKKSSSSLFTPNDYSKALGLSWLFYDAQRSGEIPSKNFPVPWRRSAHVNDVVPGGWYDAGDYLKLNFPLASTVSFLAWGLIEFKDGYKQANEYEHALDSLYIAADYLKRSHIAPRKYVGQIGHPDIDHNYWGRPEQEKTARPAYVYDDTMGASDLLGKVAAALASSSIVWRRQNATIAEDFLNHAQDLWKWGNEKSGKYSNYYKSATASIYESSDYQDDMAWGAAWLYRATGDKKYLDAALRYWSEKDWDVTVDWDGNGAATAVMLGALVDDKVNALTVKGKDMRDFVKNSFIKAWVNSDGYLEIVKTPKGLSRPKWSKWGNLQLSTTAAFLAMVHAKHLNTSSPAAIAQKNNVLNWARTQIDYAMGSSGRSFIVGFGKNPPQFAHHAGASCPNYPATCDWSQFTSTKPNPQVLYGALVGGPEGPGDDTYHDKRNDFVSNEVACDYNAGITGALAGLVEMI